MLCAALTRRLLDDAYVAGRLVATVAYLPEWRSATPRARPVGGRAYTSEVEALGHSSSAASLREFDLWDDVRVCAGSTPCRS